MYFVCDVSVLNYLKVRGVQGMLFWIEGQQFKNIFPFFDSCHTIKELLEDRWCLEHYTLLVFFYVICSTTFRWKMYFACCFSLASTIDQLFVCRPASFQVFTLRKGLFSTLYVRKTSKIWMWCCQTVCVCYLSQKVFPTRHFAHSRKKI